nr:MAG TPA: hypothetical protein [Bacteriophage sp.]
MVTVFFDFGIYTLLIKLLPYTSFSVMIELEMRCKLWILFLTG